MYNKDGKHATYEKRNKIKTWYKQRALKDLRWISGGRLAFQNQIQSIRTQTNELVYCNVSLKAAFRGCEQPHRDDGSSYFQLFMSLGVKSLEFYLALLFTAGGGV